MKDSSVTCDFANSVWGEDAIKKNDPNLLPETGNAYSLMNYPSINFCIHPDHLPDLCDIYMKYLRGFSGF